MAPIDCEQHGPSGAAYTCIHLMEGTGLGFVLGHDDGSGGHISVCEACDDTSAGDWRQLPRTNIVAACHGCFWLAMGRNALLPGFAPADSLMQTACGEMAARNADLVARTGVDRMPRYWYDQDAEIFQFNNAQDQVVWQAHMLSIGSFSERSGTWLWAWQNESIAPTARHRAHYLEGQLARFGADPAALQQDVRTLDEAMHLGSLGAWLGNADMMYRLPGDGLHVFLGLVGLERVAPPTSEAPGRRP